MNFNKLSTAIILGSLFLLASCSSDVEDMNKSVDNSSFEVGQIELISSEVRASDQNWPDLKDLAVVSFRTCITDTSYLERIAGERFIISTAGNSVEQVTNSQGCMTWSEEVKFNYLEDEKYISVGGRITAAGNFKGSSSYNMGVNPWREDIVDLKFGRVQTFVSELRALNNESGDRIVVTNASMSVVRQKYHTNQTELQLEISTKPMLTRRNINGSVIREAFNGGNFKMSYYLISKNISSNERRVISKLEQIEGINRDGRVKSLVNFRINEGINQKDIIEVAVKISAHNAPVELGSTQGLLPINQLEGTTSSELLELPEDLSVIMSRKNSFALSNSSPDDFGFIIDSVTVKPGSESGENFSNSDRRSVDATFQVCLVDSLIKDSIRNYPFDISLVDEDGSRLFSNVIITEVRTGCANFRAALPYRRYETQRWKKYRLLVESTREPFNGISKERIVNINPWIRTSDFGIDAKVGTPPEASTSNQPKIFIPGLSYNFLGHSQSKIKVNKALDLLLTRSYMVELSPSVEVNHRFDGDAQGRERLMTGNYKLRFLIMSPKANINIDYTNEVNLEDYYTLSADEKNVSIEAGLIRTKIDLPLLFTDLVPFSYKNILLVELSPLEQGTTLETGYFVGVFNGSKKQDMIGSSMESKKDLSSRNINISKALIARMNNLKNKLANDSVIPNNKANFMDLLAEENKAMVPVIDHARHRMTTAREEVAIYNNEASFKSGQGLRSSTSDISNLIDDPARLSNDLIDDICHVFYSRNQVTKQTTLHATGMMAMPHDTSIKGFEHNRCKSDFRNHVDFKQIAHMASISQQPTEIMTSAGSLNRNHATYFADAQRFGNSTGIRQSDYFEHGWSASAGLNFSKIVFLGADYHVGGGHRRDLYTMNSKDDVLSNTHQVTVQHGQRYDFDKFSVNFTARVIKCLMITPKLVKSEIPVAHKVATVFGFGKKDPVLHEVTSSKRIYVCKGSAETEEYNESYYFVKTGENGVMTDSDDMNGKLVNALRGQKGFERFREEMIETERPLVILKNQDPTLVQRYKEHMGSQGSALDYKQRLDFGFPGIIEP